MELDFIQDPTPEENQKENKTKKPRNYVNYEAIYEELQWRPLTFTEIMEMAGTTISGTSQVITTLSYNYPIWSPKQGVYKLLEDIDFED